MIVAQIASREAVADTTSGRCPCHTNGDPCGGWLQLCEDDLAEREAVGHDRFSTRTWTARVVDGQVNRIPAEQGKAMRPIKVIRQCPDTLATPGRAPFPPVSFVRQAD